LTNFIPDDERIVLIEDTAEIQIQKPNVLRFEARREQHGAPAVTIRDLLKATLRHRPDRIILGEIRGGEAFDLFQLLNTGHSGTISTVHGNSAPKACRGSVPACCEAASRCHNGPSKQISQSP
jgi:pilus assembly protein CpaF